MTTAQMTVNDNNAMLIETLTGKKPTRTDRPAPLWFDILKLSITPSK